MEFLDTTLIDTGTASLTVGQMLLALSAVIAGFVVARVVERLVVGRLRGSAMGPDVLQLVRRLLFYGLMTMVVLGALAILGIPLTAFAFVSGAIAIGVGFGAKNIFNNFISGWILMGERPIRIGDFIEFEHVNGRVEAINNRSTRIRRVDGVHMLVPNSTLLESTVINWTLVDRRFRTTVRVGVAYGSPVRVVHDLLLKACEEHPEVLSDPAPMAYFEDFGDNALVFDVYFWLEAGSEGGARGVRSDIRFAIEEAFGEHGIVVAFPQRDIHVDGTLMLDRRSPE
ncbi:small-conductance mechanosensitive channel [Methylohalomonas lacus]|uniref:Small-conductance mechanosensitive channel n=1 Tax=Methylohalomonas lacus TaxID=398773 RepID=A0AAE3HJ73_9GAMM|nr:mechanosensitive ion channel domain-containing protein [Methylohalomonas lacus]MCS3902840.1 small-conductance mechanosensitive channel [Methylohalomonas lacus]